MATSGEALEFISNLKILSYIAMAFSVCAIYDFLIKYNNEMEIVAPAFNWQQIQRALRGLRTEWSWTIFIVRIVYLLGRYAGIALHVYMAVVITRQSSEGTLEVSREFAIINGFLGTVVLCATQALIALRIYRSLSVFDPLKPKARMGLKFGFVLEFGVLLAMQAIASVSEVVKLEDNGNSLVGACSASAFPDWLYGMWIPVLCFELAMLTLAARAHREHSQNNGILQSQNTERYGGSRGDSVRIILRDSLVSLVVLATICIINLFGHQLFGEIVPVQTSFALSTIGSILAGSQLLTNLHQVRSDPEDEGPNAANAMELRVMFSVPQVDEAESPQPSRMHSSKDLGVYDEV